MQPLMLRESPPHQWRCDSNYFGEPQFPLLSCFNPRTPRASSSHCFAPVAKGFGRLLYVLASVAGFCHVPPSLEGYPLVSSIFAELYKNQSWSFVEPPQKGKGP